MSNHYNNRKIVGDRPQREVKPIVIVAIVSAVLALLIVTIVIVLINREPGPVDPQVLEQSQIESVPPQSVTESNGCEHAVWDSYNQFGHQCRACGIKEAHKWVNNTEGIKYCELCYEIERNDE